MIISKVKTVIVSQLMTVVDSDAFGGSLMLIMVFITLMDFLSYVKTVNCLLFALAPFEHNKLMFTITNQAFLKRLISVL